MFSLYGIFNWVLFQWFRQYSLPTRSGSSSSAEPTFQCWDGISSPNEVGLWVTPQFSCMNKWCLQMCGELREGFPIPLRNFVPLVPLPSSHQNSWLIHKKSVIGSALSQGPWWLWMSLVEAHVSVIIFYETVIPLLFCVSLWTSLCVISDKLDDVPDHVSCPVDSTAPWQLPSPLWARNPWAVDWMFMFPEVLCWNLNPMRWY